MNLDKSLDEIISEKKPRQGPSSSGRRGRHRSGRRVDKFSDSASRPRPVAESRPGATLSVSNVFYDLTEDELRGLFNRVGPVRSLRIDYDRSGRSLGTARVVYDDIEDAYEAIKRYNGKKAAGQELQIEIAGRTNRPLGDRMRREPAAPPRGPRQSGEPRSQPHGERGTERGGSRRGGRGKVRKTAAELDAELDAYMSGSAAPEESAAAASTSTTTADKPAEPTEARADAAPSAPPATEDEIMID